MSEKVIRLTKRLFLIRAKDKLDYVFSSVFKDMTTEEALPLVLQVYSGKRIS